MPSTEVTCCGVVRVNGVNKSTLGLKPRVVSTLSAHCTRSTTETILQTKVIIIIIMIIYTYYIFLARLNLKYLENTLPFLPSTEFHTLNEDILMKALRSLEIAGKAELMEFGDNQGIKFL